MNPGYKQSEVGVIPDEWEVVRLEYAAEIIDPQPDHRTPPECTGGDPYIGISDFLDDRTINWEASRKIIPRAIDKQRARFLIRRGDIIFGKIGTIGMPKFVPAPHVRYGLSANVLLLQPKVEPFYLMSWLRSDTFQRAVNAELHSTSQAAFGINKMRRMLIPKPPESEQRAIAKALSDMDGLLGGLDRLIAKKRDLKQAAMQQLLTGQTRLPGFHGEWEVKRLGDAFSISAGKSKSAYLVVDGDYWVCDMGSVSTEGRLIVSKRTNYRGDFLGRGDLIMPKDDIGGGNIIGKVGYIDANDTYILGDHVYCLRALEGDPRFLAYVINSNRVNSELRKKVIGSAQLGLGRKSVNEQEIQFPQIPEQTTIAEVLTEMDAELLGLEQRREKTRALKQAMMQDLLTGMTRLI